MQDLLVAGGKYVAVVEQHFSEESEARLTLVNGRWNQRCTVTIFRVDDERGFAVGEGASGAVVPGKGLEHGCRMLLFQFLPNIAKLRNFLMRSGYDRPAQTASLASQLDAEQSWCVGTRKSKRTKPLGDF